jgi:uncharacterized protein
MDSGISPDLYINNLLFTRIQKSAVHGYGLFAGQDLHPSTNLGELDGQIMGWDAYHQLLEACDNLTADYKHYFFMEWNCINPDTLLVRPFRTRYSLINHSRNPNLEIAYNPLRIIVIRFIPAGSELLLDYRKEPLPAHYYQNNQNSFL